MSLFLTCRLSTLCEAQHDLCALCGGRMDRSRRALRRYCPDRATVEHIYPQVLGGAHGPGNLVAAHARCNTAKGPRWPNDVEIAALKRVNDALGWATFEPMLPSFQMTANLCRETMP